MSKNNTAIIIPVYNCAGAIGPLLEKIRALSLPCGIIVVNDGSRDNTAGMVKQYPVTLLSHEKNLGKGAALQTGLLHARKQGCEFAVTLDGDGQHAPEDIPAFLACSADLVIGRRKFGGAMPLSRVFSNTLSSFILSRAAGRRVPDSQCGFRKVRLSMLDGFSPSTAGYQYETEMILHVARVKKGAVGSVPVRTIYGREKSYIRHVPDTWAFLRAVWRYLWITG
jgi:glycosyltransferase involved in cell wall biosynthesis